jgi:hypothetical protein
MQRETDQAGSPIAPNAAGNAPTQQQKHRWFGWAGRHPGVVLLGTMLVVVLALPKPSRSRDVERDTTGEEVPLFV